MNIKIVVGANYGDEGKGLATDYFAYKANDRVIGVLTNGSSQRAHTVDTIDGKHHIFNHFSSGTFRGADTYICKDFIIDPIRFVDEYLELYHQYGIEPKVYIHPECKFITPFDILSNLKEQENTGKHNTCGNGVWKTIERYKKGYGALGIRKYLYANIETTSSSDPYYYWTELNHYYKNDITNYDAHINIEGLKVRYKMDLDFLLAHSLFVEESILKSYDTIIFENGQGLLLGEQQSEETWWSGTPSNTGCLIASNIINDNMLRGIIEVCYVTRTYLTRHGIGELPNECKFKEDINISIGYDATNYRNTTQGCLRYAPLDIESLQERIDQDFLLAPFGSRKSIMFTHWNENKIKLSDKDDFIDNIDRLYISKTKNAEDIHP